VRDEYQLLKIVRKTQFGNGEIRNAVHKLSG